MWWWWERDIHIYISTSRLVCTLRYDWYILHLFLSFRLSIFTLCVVQRWRQETERLGSDGNMTASCQILKSQQQLRNNAQKIFVSIFSPLALFPSFHFCLYHPPLSLFSPLNTLKASLYSNTVPSIFTAGLWLNSMSYCIFHNRNLHRHS